MTFNPGRSVGRVSIRVVPDTKRFPKDLARDLSKIAKFAQFKVKVDGANLDRAKFRESLQRQLAEMKGIEADSNVTVTVSKAKLRKAELTKSIQDEFDKMAGVRVWIAPRIHKNDQERFQRQVKQMVDQASRNSVNIGANAHTIEAAAQLRYVTRPRWVDIFVRVSKSSVASALTTLAALSGARLSWQWIDSLIEKVGRLDKSLPSIVNWTSGITALFAAIAGSVSGLAGIGAGLFSITPALLVLPGLFLNALGSLTVLIVALKNSSKELGVLGDDMRAIGDVINTQFWDRARQPIIDLVKGLMPQLLSSFHDLAAGVGDFTAAMSRAFGQELANGRLASIFNGIAEGWRILGTGASGFAGALVNLSEIASKYTPRLAYWFVRQANTFDAWLTAIATDKRLDRWMEGAIDSMYDLWDATRGFAGVLTGIWRAASTAGSAGLGGFAGLMLQWRDVVNSTKFQTGLAAIFRGSYVAMDAFGEAIKSLGHLIGNMPDTFERFVGSVGGFIGGVFDEAFKALDNAQFRIGLDGFSEGLETALAGIKPALDPIARTFGNFIGLLGDLAGNLLPTAAGVLADLMPALDSLIDAIGPVLPDLTSVVSQFADTLAPHIAALADALGPALPAAFRTLSDALYVATPALQAVADTLTAVLERFSWLQGWSQEETRKAQLAAGSDEWFADLAVILPPQVLRFTTDSTSDENVHRIAENIGKVFDGEMEKGGESGAQKFKDALAKIDFPNNLKTELEHRLGDIWPDFSATATASGVSLALGLSQGFAVQYPELVAALTAAGTGAMDGFKYGTETGKPAVLAAIAALPPEIRAQIPTDVLYGVGYNLTLGLAAGMKDWQALAVLRKSAELSVGEAVRAAQAYANINSPSRLTRDTIGKPLAEGIAVGIDKHRRGIASALVGSVRDAVTGAQGQTGGVGGRGFGGTNIHITQPLLPGETPQEQRDNLIRELKLAV